MGLVNAVIMRSRLGRPRIGRPRIGSTGNRRSAERDGGTSRTSKPAPVNAIATCAPHDADPSTPTWRTPRFERASPIAWDIQIGFLGAPNGERDGLACCGHLLLGRPSQSFDQPCSRQQKRVVSIHDGYISQALRNPNRYPVDNARIVEVTGAQIAERR